ncbi:RimK family alpha-L-glutamate ligase [Gemmata sp. JC673]|uniref:RimK family alpha-L-glutamate ligase n=1 Tax=Gemmata algarum TaxID=2975278 RepID=A0ABU5F9H4_9BACT|nr:RimK family alpha-L-glutamate ligase [Gemmata algarum]MDY3563442.1 RimK family alpha-L-glutamate ligase [Gemmata algarum]
MNIAILSGGTGWHVQDLVRAAAELGHTVTPLDFRALSASVNAGRAPLSECDALLVRTMPAGSLEQVVFRMDLLHECAARGVPVLNPPRAVEVCVDKYLTTARLARAGIDTPPTAVCQRSDDALAQFAALGGDVVLKPLFGSEGRGMCRITDPETAWRTFRVLEQTGQVIYLQQFIRHPGWDLRAFVLGDRVIASMRRTAGADWRTNVAQGGTAERVSLSAAEAALALRAARAVGCPVAGVDLLPGPNGELFVIEVNAVPGWKALASACGVDVAKEVVRFVTER